MHYKQNDKNCNSNDEEEEVYPAAGEVEFHQPGNQKKVEENMNGDCQRPQQKSVTHRDDFFYNHYSS